jgi:alpha-beta hydrolase superfamily lysophospholipase
MGTMQLTAGVVIGALLAGQLALAASAQPTATRPTPNPSSDTGTINGAAYRIDFPPGWNGGVVLFAHGYNPGPPQPLVIEWSIPDFLSRGYAVAQSRYRTEGWAVKEGIEDIEALRMHIVRRYGRPRETYIAGMSMGGLISVATAELHPRAYDGALVLCGLVMPATQVLRERMLDMIVSFDFLFPGVLGDDPGHMASDPADSAAWANQSHSITAALAASPEKARAFAARFGMPDSVSAGQLPFILQFYASILDNVVRHAGGNPFDNRNTIYGGFLDDSALNRGVHRATADTGALDFLARYYTPNGRIQFPMLALHATGDQAVPSWVVNDYDARTAAAGAERFFVVQYVVAANHCGFSHAQIGSAFDELRTWVHGGARPNGGLLATRP